MSLVKKNPSLNHDRKPVSRTDWPRKANQLFEAASSGSAGRFLLALEKDGDEPVDCVLLQRDLRSIRLLAGDVDLSVSTLPQLIEAQVHRTPHRNSGLEEALRRVRGLVKGRLIGRPAKRESGDSHKVLRGVQRELRKETKKLPLAVQTVMANSRAPSTQRAQLNAIRAFVKSGFDPRSDGIAQFLIVVESLARTRSANTVISYTGHMLSLIEELRGEDWRESKLVRAMTAGLKRRGDSVTHTPPLRLTDLLRIVAVIDARTLVGRRDRALLLIGFAFGFRCSELCVLEWDQVLLPAGQKLRISAVTKTSRLQKRHLDNDNDFYQRIVPAFPLLDEILSDYYKLLPHGARYLWPQLGTNDEITDQPIKPHQVRALLRKYSAMAGVDYHRPHSLRAGCITELARRGATTLQIARTSGHRTDRMILQYTNLALASLS